jgi:hypothetical protein
MGIKLGSSQVAAKCANHYTMEEFEPWQLFLCSLRKKSKEIQALSDVHIFFKCSINFSFILLCENSFSTIIWHIVHLIMDNLCKRSNYVLLLAQKIEQV